ncbi:uncharacterized protein N7477_007122 [Penicillium maclennaniae]|uniref:uncharacterized protein n=1 Tax=Penicillium maclennaniae TaxID=1343394 RepID=UPI002540CB0E|nr:uncharacterized protein N7477_007122 [Penicillium maclennaniae]KAJ5668552.1 hypothetical protein N7477_007122 [Penicillium maclennaniae]
MLEKPASQRAFPDALNSCAVPIYTTAAFAFNNVEHGVRLLNIRELGIYSRITNPTVSLFQNRMAALEGGVAACAVASGTAAVSMTLMALAGVGDNIVLAPQLGIECRFVPSNDPEDFRALIDEKIKFLFVESISNPKYTVPDFEALAEIAHANGIPLICDNTFGCAGYYCRPIDYGVDIALHSATKWIGGHGTTLGGVIVDAGTFDWGSHADKFPQFHANSADDGSGEVSLWNMFGSRAFAMRCQFEVLRDIGSTMSPQAAQQLIIGLESLAVRCDRHASNIEALAVWLAQQPQVAWVRYLGNEDHPCHQHAKKYLQRGYGAVFSFGIKGGKAAGFRLCDELQMIINTTKDTLVVHPWTTTHQQLTDSERFDAGVTEDHMRLSVGIEHIEDIKDDFRRVFQRMNSSRLSIANVRENLVHQQEQKRIIQALFGLPEPLPLSQSAV